MSKRDPDTSSAALHERLRGYSLLDALTYRRSWRFAPGISWRDRRNNHCRVRACQDIKSCDCSVPSWSFETSRYGVVAKS
jgi:hypothetical protein